jgi:hypothetical protein
MSMEAASTADTSSPEQRTGEAGAQRESLRRLLQDAVRHLEHVLPGQAPIRDFVHHNTLHGFQHLRFPEALAQARKLTGVRAYLPEAQSREFYRQGRITRADLEAVLIEVAGIDPAEVLIQTLAGPLTRLEVQLAVLVHPVRPITPAQFRWQIEEHAALTSFQADVPPQARARVMAAARQRGIDHDAGAIADLWAALLETLGVASGFRHAEELLQPPRPAPAAEGAATEESEWRDRGQHLWLSLTDRLGRDWTLRSLLLALTGEDILDTVRPSLIRHLGAHLDQGLAAWHNPARGRGFYAAWRRSVRDDLAWELDELSEVRRHIETLPTDSLEAVVAALASLDLAEERWPGYLERLALELPGWSGMFLWRHRHPGYAGLREVPVSMMDYLAVRLNAERLVAQNLVRRQWGLAMNLGAMREYFRRHPAELRVRHAYHQAQLPEYLLNLVERQLAQTREMLTGPDDAAWRWLAGQLDAWHDAPANISGAEHGVTRVAWPLLRLAQHLGLSGGDIRAFGQPGVEKLLLCLGALDENATGFVWLNAYERHYRELIFAALSANHGRWSGHAGRPEAQIVFCMDDREEGMRRHVEEINPALETLGAAAHFGVFQNWRGLDDREVTPLCPVVPVVVRPAHEVRELAREGADRLAARHRHRLAQRRRWQERLFQDTRRGFFLAPLMTAAAAPAALAALTLKSLRPARAGAWAGRLREAFERVVPTRLALTAPADSPPATPEQPREGFTDAEQAERVLAFLRAMGLTANFAPLVVIMGHGSNSQNNPHLAAYDCGACAGRHSGPNARLFAAMANRGPVRGILAGHGVVIPDDSWFVGAEHNTCDDGITWYDVEDIPAPLRQALVELDEDLSWAARAHAVERCRRFASAPASPTPARAWRHVLGRRHDFSQARPELGHATNACAFIGRRTLSRGAFFDRRAFLISYDPTQDADGLVLERLLLANGPVGAGISLEYYFSTVNNEHFGCGTKTMHNVTGYFGVMEGASSDLRTGLPRQMIEIHEAMRLLVVAEHRTDVITSIYRRQPPLQELVGNCWIVLAAKDPDSPELHLFDPERGWRRWQGGATPPTVARSADWFAGQSEPLAPALLVRPLESGA